MGNELILCKEVGKRIWNNLKFDNGSFYSEHFEEWFKDCFAECINEAYNEFNNLEKGSFIELKSYITKTGNPVIIDFDKEHFFEYYGEKKVLEDLNDEECIEE